MNPMSLSPVFTLSCACVMYCGSPGGGGGLSPGPLEVSADGRPVPVGILVAAASANPRFYGSRSRTIFGPVKGKEFLTGYDATLGSNDWRGQYLSKYASSFPNHLSVMGNSGQRNSHGLPRDACQKSEAPFWPQHDAKRPRAHV